MNWETCGTFTQPDPDHWVLDYRSDVPKQGRLRPLGEILEDYKRMMRDRQSIALRGERR